jgi:hypothetical protein
MEYALAKLPEESFVQPEIVTAGVKPIIRGEYVDAQTVIKTLSEENKDELDISTLYNSIHSILHYVDKNNPQGPYPQNPAQDPQYANWEYSVQKWKEATFGSLLSPTTETEEAGKEEEANSNTTRRRSRD